jgi:hypothetical protein
MEFVVKRSYGDFMYSSAKGEKIRQSAALPRYPYLALGERTANLHLYFLEYGTNNNKTCRPPNPLVIR